MASEEPDWEIDGVDLVRFLRGGDFKLGAQEALRVTELLRMLAQHGRSPRSVDEAAKWLAPVLCTSARQQALLRDRLETFGFSQRASPVSVARPVDAGEKERTLPRVPAWIRYIALAFSAGVVAFFVWRYTQSATEVATANPRAGHAVPGNIEPLDWQHWLSEMLPFLLLASVAPQLWLVVYRYRSSRKVVLARRPYDGRRSASVNVGGKCFAMYSGCQMSRAAQGMRAHRKLPSSRPDARASIRATTAAGGMPILVPGLRPQLPDYPLVIEAVSSGDHLVALGRSLGAKLKSEGVAHTQYFYCDDLRRLRTDSESSAPLTLADLSARFQEDVLLIVGDGSTLLDSWLGTLRPSLHELEFWRAVVLLTPVAPRRWSWRERRLSEAGIIVLPATTDGLLLLGEYLRSESRKPRLAQERAPARPGPLTSEGRDSCCWHSEQIPSPEDREATLDAIALELNHAAFELAGVLALFPEVRPDLTLHVASAMKGRGSRPFIEEGGLASLMALPWFRFGRMPDWLRLELARSLDPARTEEAREIFAGWLTQPSGQPSAETIQITADNLGRVVTEDVARNPSSPVRDEIFLRFSRKEDLNELDLNAPGQVLRAVQRKGQDKDRLGFVLSFGLGALLLLVAGMSPAVREFVRLQLEILSRYELKSLVITWLCIPLLGLTCGLWALARRRARDGSRFGPWPLVFAILTCLVGAVPPLMERLDPVVSLTLVLGVLPCIGLGLGSRSRPEPTISCAMRAGHAFTFPAVVVACCGVLILPIFAHNVATERDDLAAFNLGLLLHATGAGIVYAKLFRVSVFSAVLHAVVASTFADWLLVILKLTDFQPPIVAMFVCSLILAHLGCALLVTDARRISVAPAFWVCAIAAILVVSAGFLMPIDKETTADLYLLFAPLPAVIVLVPQFLEKPLSVRQLPVWVSALAAVFLGLTVFARAANLLESSPLATAAQITSLFAFVPAIRAALNLDQRNLWSRLTAPLWAYLPDRRIFLLILFLAIGIGFAVGGAVVDLGDLYLPLTIVVAAWLGAEALPVVAVGAMPLLLGVDVSATVVTSPDVGLYVACILLCRFIAEPAVRSWARMLLQVEVLELTAIALLGGLQFSIPLLSASAPDQIDVQVSIHLESALAVLMILLGVARISRTRILVAMTIAGSATIAALVLTRRTVDASWIGFSCNVVMLVPLYELGRSWAAAFVASDGGNASPQRLRKYTRRLEMCAFVVLAISSAQSWLFVPLFSNSAVAMFAGYLAIGAARPHWNSMLTGMVAATICFLFKFAAAVSFALQVQNELRAEIGVLTQFLSAIPVAVGAALLGRHISRITRSTRGEWLRQHGLAWLVDQVNSMQGTRVRRRAALDQPAVKTS